MASGFYFVSLVMIFGGIFLMFSGNSVYILDHSMQGLGIGIFTLGSLISVLERFLRFLSETRIFYDK